MDTLTTRQRKLLRCFHEQEIISSQTLSSQMQISRRTLRNEIKAINACYPSLIIAMKSKGYRRNAHHPYLLSLQIDDEEFKNTRYLSILKQVLSYKSCDYYALADQLYISETTLDKQISSMNRIIKRINPAIRIERKQNQLYMNGDEEHHRQIYSFLLNHEMDQYHFKLSNYTNLFSSCDIEEIKAYVLWFHQVHHLQMRDFEIISFILHIAIMLERIQKGNTLTTITAYEEHKEANELAKQFAIGIKQRFHIDLPILEHRYLSCLFLGKISISNEDKLHLYHAFIKEIIMDIANQYHLDLHHDQDFHENLMVHLLGLDQRIRSGSFLNNPLSKDIKLHFPILYDISVWIAMKYQNQFHVSFLEDEIGYITLHVMSAVEKIQQQNVKKIVLLSPLGNAATSYLKQKLMRNSDYTIEICATFSMFDTISIYACNPDLVISFLPLAQALQIPNYTCSGFPKEYDIERILQLLKKSHTHTLSTTNYFHENLFFTKLSCTTKEEVIHFLCQQLQKQRYCDENYEKKVQAREQIAPTAYGDMLAIPHAIERCSYQNAVAVAILKSPILWNNKKIKLIFLLSICNEKDNDFDTLYRQLVQLHNHKQHQKHLIKQEDYTSFINIIKQLDKLL